MGPRDIMLTVAELTDAVHREVKRLSKSGDDHAAAGDHAAAISAYEQALSALPEPVHQWDAFTWLKVAIADASFLGRRFEQAREALNEVLMFGPEESGANPFIQLRFGQSLLELGEEEKAADWLARAFLTTGKQLFAEDDPKYLRFICSKLDPPDGFDSWEAVFDKEKRRWWRFW
jgi:tetratricopeptide (TPR) repeat protein